MKLFVLFVAFAVANALPRSASQVEVPNLGSFVGSTSTTRGGRTVHQFLGIPFAHSVGGEARFLPPKRIEQFNSTFDATTLGQRCPEISLPTQYGWPYFRYDPDAPLEDVTRSTADPEDCLNLNVYTPQVNSDTKLPVFVYFHGGAFLFGSSHEYKPEYLLDKDIVMVVPQYRLGPLGYLSFNEDELAGNYGLLDQVMALQWVKDNIQYFGGDPEQVTIGGQSAGAASVSLMKYTPLAKGLFHRIIAHSGTALAPWAVDTLDPAVSSRSIARLTGFCNQKETSDVVACLRKQAASKFVTSFGIVALATMGQGKLGLSGALPTVQMAGTKFLEQRPKDILDNNGEYTSVPMLMGAVKHEGVFVAQLIHRTYMEPNKYQNDAEFLKHEFLEDLLKLFGSEDDYHVVVYALLENYFEPHQLGNLTAMWPGIIDYCGNMFIKGPVYREAKYNSEKSDTYLYSFNYQGSRPELTVTGETDTFGVTGGIDHSSDLKFLFPSKAGLNAEEEEVSKKMVNLWTNFIIKGKPESPEGVPEWPTFSVDNDVYLKIDKEFTVESDYSKEYKAAVTEFKLKGA